MKSLRITVLCLLFCISNSFSQSIQDIIDQVDLNRLTLTLEEFTGEQNTIVGGNAVTILNRQHFNNDIAADYLVERLQELDNITILDQPFNSSGRNIVATQIGKTNPNDIYMICAHYDAVTNYGADDNGTGVVAVLEAARILSTQCLDNTIIYAFWDEEEIGLLGSEFYADQAAANGDNILEVLNLDMMGYDGDAPGTPGDNDFDIDVRNIAGSIAMKDDIINVLNTYSFDLNVIVVDPGYYFSDHGSFWDNGYTGLLLGESWETNDQSPFYHTIGDRVATLDLQYFHELTKLTTAYMATKGGLLAVDNTVTTSPTMLTSNQNSANYQWIDCGTGSAISGATSQSYSPSSDGNFAVQITIGSCTEISECISFSTLEIEEFSNAEIRLFPNPVSEVLQVEIPEITNEVSLVLYDLSGKVVFEKTTTDAINALYVKGLSNGIYLLKVNSSTKTRSFKIVKE